MYLFIESINRNALPIQLQTTSGQLPISNSSEAYANSVVPLYHGNTGTSMIQTDIYNQNQMASFYNI